MQYEWDIMNGSGNYPIHYCILYNNKMLINPEISPYILKTKPNALQEDPLYYAIKNKQYNLLTLILSK